MNGQTEWPALVADLEAKRAAIDSVIATIKKHFVGGNGEMPASPIVGRTPGARPPRKYTRRAVQATNGNGASRKTNERTNERSKA